MAVTIPVWELSTDIPYTLQEDVSDCAYKVFLADGNILSTGISKTPVQLLRELNEKASAVLNELRSLRAIKLTGFMIDSLLKDNGRYKIIARITGSDRISRSVSFEI